MMRIAILWLLATGFAVAQKNPVVLSVNGKSIMADELAYLFGKNYPQIKDHTPEKVNEYLKLYIRFRLKVEEALSRKLDTTLQFQREYATYRDELRKTYLQEDKITDSLVQLTYNRLREEVSAWHILVAVAPDAAPADTLQAWQRINEILARAHQGEPFDQLAEKFSDDPSARNNRGYLGYFTALQMVYPFETAAYTGKPGQILGPVRTRFGYHLIKIENRKPSRGEVEVSHIMLRHQPWREETQTRNLIFDIHEQLRQGVPWNDLCARYSEDLSSKSNNCKLRPFGVGAMAQVPEFDAVAFALQNPGDLSDPFRTAYGWHIVRLERKIPLPPLAELESSLRSRVMRDERMQVARSAYYAKLKKRYVFTENQDVIQQLLQAADSVLKYKGGQPSYLPLQQPLITVAGKPVYVEDFLKYVKLHRQAGTQKPAEQLAQLYNKFVEQQLAEQVEAELIRQKPDYRFLLKEYYEGILLFDIMEKEVWNRAAADTAGLRKFYEANRNKYQAEARALATIYSASSAADLEPLQALLSQRDSTAAAQWVVEKRIRTDAGKFQVHDRPVLQSVPWQPGLHPAQNNGMYYLVHILQILPPAPLSFEEAKMVALTDYQQELEDRWVEHLQQKFPVKVHEKGRKYLIRRLRS
jgi:peptidyl-prolyl cis-trans isomerase SurA